MSDHVFALELNGVGITKEIIDVNFNKGRDPSMPVAAKKGPTI